MTALGICLSLAALSGPAVWVPGDQFTLAWTHSVERTRWEEDYTVQWRGAPAQAVLIATEARIRGSGAGMEPPPDAVLNGGWWRYTPTIRQPLELPLMRSGFVPDFERCDAQGCQPLSNWLPSDGGVTLLRACESPKVSSRP
ncbi:Protein of unknown function DUF1850 [Burkholderiaceae bacterium]